MGTSRQLSDERLGEPSVAIQGRVEVARERHRQVDDAGKSLLRADTCTCSAGTSVQQLHMSARAYHRTQSVKLARTIADLAGSEGIETPHFLVMERIPSTRSGQALGH